MKIVASILAAALVIVMIYFSSSGMPLELHQDDELPPGEVNPPLRRLDSDSKIPTGARLWFDTNRSSYARVLDEDPGYDFSGHRAPAILIEARSGTQWVPRSALQASWTDR